MGKIFIRFAFFVLLFFLLIGGIFSIWAWRNAEETRVIFLDVGQGDAILITQGGNQVLIDGGRSGKVLLAELSRYVPFWDRTIETVIMTHPDADHIGGLPDLLRAYRVRGFISTGASSSSEIFGLLQDRLSSGDESPERIEAREGLTITFPNGGMMRVLYPHAALPEGTESNEGSVVTRFSYGETDFLLTGDLPEEERYLRDPGVSEILKVSHHGSKHSTSEAFLDLIRPNEAVISVGKNSYGHPAPEVISRIATSGALIRRTDLSGGIPYRCTTALNRCVFSGPTR
ncbi:MAG: MBL fold metallo-hydrolase [Candidatus Moranbacteria bacterium]|nr:MBL fold metallo-hydrolase [Candidatus Moranbacteria bacterium]